MTKINLRKRAASQCSSNNASYPTRHLEHTPNNTRRTKIILRSKSSQRHFETEEDLHGLVRKVPATTHSLDRHV